MEETLKVFTGIVFITLLPHVSGHCNVDCALLGWNIRCQWSASVVASQ